MNERMTSRRAKWAPSAGSFEYLPGHCCTCMVAEGAGDIARETAHGTPADRVAEPEAPLAFG